MEKSSANSLCAEMDIERTNLILSELLDISKEFRVGYPIKKFIVKISDLKNFDFDYFYKLSKCEHILSSEKSTFSKYEKVLLVPLLEIEEDIILFYPSVIKRYKEEFSKKS